MVDSSPVRQVVGTVGGMAERYTDDLNVCLSRWTLAELVDQFIEDHEFEHDPRWVSRWSLRQFARNDFDTFDREHRQTALDPAPQLVGHPGWDGFFAALADFLAQRDELIVPAWVNEPERQNTGPMFYPGVDESKREAVGRLVAADPAPWFTDRGVGLALSELPSGMGKHVKAKLRDGG